MDALSLLKSDHERVKKLFESAESEESSGKGLESVSKEIVRELSIHAAIEEQVFYPALKKQGGELRDHVLEALEEHHVAKWLLDEINGMKSSEERFKAKIKVLIESVKHHIREEEETLFPLVRKSFDENQLSELAETLEKAKKLAPTRPHPRAPDEPPGNLVAGMMAGVMDRGRDLLRGKRAAKRPEAAAKTARKTGTPRAGGRGRSGRGKSVGGRGSTGRRSGRRR